jgi:sugar (pentulose or hexulose) kinase
LGAAFVAGMGAGVFGDWGQIKRYIEIGGITEPDEHAHAVYRRLFGLYRDLYEANRPLFRRLEIETETGRPWQTV